MSPCLAPPGGGYRGLGPDGEVIPRTGLPPKTPPHPTPTEDLRMHVTYHRRADMPPLVRAVSAALDDALNKECGHTLGREPRIMMIYDDGRTGTPTPTTTAEVTGE